MVRFHALSVREQTIIHLLSINIGPMRLDDIARCLLELLPQNKRAAASFHDRKEIAAILKNLEQEQLTTKKNGTACCQPLIRREILLIVLKMGLFSAYNDILHTIKAQEKPGWERTFTSLDEAMRQLQLALFDPASFPRIDTIGAAIHHEYSHVLKENPILSFFGQDQKIILPLLELCAHPQGIGVYLLNGFMEKMKDASAIRDFLINTFIADPILTNPFPFVKYLLFAGQHGLAATMLEKEWPEKDAPYKSCARGDILFFQGRYREALPFYDEAIETIKHLTGKRKVALGAYSGLFHLLSLLTTGEAKDLQRGKDLAALVKKSGELPPALLENVTALFVQQSGQMVNQALVNRDRFLYQGTPLYRFFYFLTIWWLDREKAVERLSQECQGLRAQALDNTYFWIVAECAGLLAALGVDPEANRKQANKLHRQRQSVSCLNIIQQQDQNIQRLRGLLAIYGNRQDTPNSQAPTASEQRLVWHFSFFSNQNQATLAPILQKMGKNGKWSGGRNVALKTLYTSFETLDYLSDQDRRLCRTLVHSTGSGSYFYGNRETYAFDPKKALAAAVGHPALFLSDHPAVQIDLGAGEFELRVSKKDQNLTLSLWPTPPNDTASSFVVRESPTSFKVYQIRLEHQDLLILLNKDLVLPTSSTDQVRELASSLSTLVTVHSDVGGGQEAAEIASDPLPHLHLLPFQDGLRAEILVRPIAGSGSWHPPAEGGTVVFGEQDGKRVQAHRDFEQEIIGMDRLLTACPQLEMAQEMDGNDKQHLFPDPESSLELLAQLRQYPDCVPHWPRGQSFTLRTEKGLSNLSLHIKKDRDWFSATGSVQVDDDTVLGLQQLLKLLDTARGRFVQLEDGSFLALTRSLQKRLQELQVYAEKTEKGKEGVRFNPLAALALDDLTSEASVESDKQWKAHKKKLAAVVQPSVPSTLAATLRDYQAQGFAWLAQLSHWQVGACLADDMGLGKTLQALAAILLRAAQGPTLVVAPLSVMSNWADEAARFAPTLQVKFFGDGSAGNRQEILDSLGPFYLLISSYGLLQVEGEKLAAINWQVVVLDEAQAIKNRLTKRAKAALSLRAEFRLITTGTPLENHLGELWALFNFINPGLLGTHQRFTDTFATPIERDKDRNRLKQLQRLIHPFILRRMKNDVLQELPAKTEITLQVEPSPEEAALYEAQRKNALLKLEAGSLESGAGEGPQHLQILAEIMKLRRLCCNPSLVVPESGIASSKLKVFASTLDSLLENRHKALVFSQFIDHLTIIRNLLDEKNIPYQYLDGSTTANQRKERIAAFQSGIGVVFLISLKAGGSGLNLTAADFVIHMDPWWNPAVEDQASDRAHRIGQERPVTVYRLVMKGTIEEQIVSLHKDKRDLANSLLDGADAAGKLNAVELLNLLRESGKG